MRLKTLIPAPPEHPREAPDDGARLLDAPERGGGEVEQAEGCQDEGRERDRVKAVQEELEAPREARAENRRRPEF